MKKTIILLSALFFILPSLAKAQEAIPQGSVLRGTYQEERVNVGFKKPLRSQGVFVISTDHGIIWEAQKPFSTKTIITQKGIVQEVDHQKTMALDADKIPFIDQLYKLIGSVLVGKWEELDRDFIVQKTGDKNKWKVTISTRHVENENMPFSSIEVSGRRFADKVVLKKKDGGIHTLLFTNQKMSSSPLSTNEMAAYDMVGH